MSSDSASFPELCATGVSGLDDVLGGGLPKYRLYLIEGDPGVGKTTLALQFLLEGVRRGETVLYITLSETKEELIAVARSHKWSLDGITLFELSSIEQQLRSETEHTFFHPSEVELNKTTKVLLDEIERVKPTRVVFDSLSEMRMMAETALRYRRQVLSLKQFLAGKKCTVLFLDDRTSDAKDLQVRSLSHGVVVLERTSPKYGISRRSLLVEKIRGVKFREGYHDFSIETGGLVIYPRLVAGEHFTEFKRESFPSGIEHFDTLLGGGIDRGTSTIIMGPPGTGKSTLAIKHAYEAAKRGERVDLFIFDETIGTLVARTAELGMDVQPFIKSGLIRIQKIDPAEISPGELSHCIRMAVENDNTRMVLIDSLNGYLNAMPEEHFLTLQLHELLAYLNQQGVTSILVLAQQGLIGPMHSIVELTYLADTVILLRYFETTGEVKQAISVVKKRSGMHERTIREFRIDASGIQVGKPLREFHGILTGIPEFSGKSEQMLTEKESV